MSTLARRRVAVRADIRTGIREDLLLAHRQLLAAQKALRLKDTPAARRRVAGWRDRLDGLLDLWNDLVGS